MRRDHAVPVLLTGFAGNKARLADAIEVAVVGGGLAGLAAATVLAERGARVTVIESEHYLGGRLGAWSDCLADGTPFGMERGFHAFFRQYYNLRALIRRFDPELGGFDAVPDYPILTPDGGFETFAGLPARPPWNVAVLTLRTKTMGFLDLLRVDKRAALEMLRFSREQTFARFDCRSSESYLDQLNFPPRARERLLHVFAHSCFNPQSDMSAAELLQMFHFYFTGNRDGLIFDIANRPFSQAVFDPLERYLGSFGVAIRRGTSVTALGREATGWRVATGEGDLQADAVVLAAHVPAVKAIVGASTGLDDPAWRARIDSLRATNAFAVWRLWLDRPAHPGRVPFAGTAGVGRLDNISLYHLFEDESREWANRTGGSVVELHAYALPDHVDEAELRADLRRGLQAIYPEFAGARVLEDRWLLRADCPSFYPGSAALRPGVGTPWPGLVLAGDFVSLSLPTALMERAVTAGFLAASTLLSSYDVAPEPLWSVPPRGVLA
ncbi:MAG: FAD-dependent oxidoreductase [Gammaproteobacteria bacterium]|nr:FAD-dependent oxidoreductase [Gammaproteobacteria bacterium]